MNTDSMMHTRGLVIEANDNGFAQVVMDRKSACSGCESGKIDKCRSCLTGAKISAQVINKEHAQKGDIVSVSLSTSKVLKGAAVLYLIPVVGLIMGAFFGQSLSNLFTISETLGGLIGSFAGLGLGFYCVRLISDKMNNNQGMIPRISKIIHNGSGISPVGELFNKKSNTCSDCR